MNKLLLIHILGLIILSACGGGSSTGGSGSSTATATATEATKENLLIAMAPKTSSIALLPPAPDIQAAKSSIAGVDTNTNGVRDDIEILLAKATMHEAGAASSADFSKLLDIVKLIQPSEATKTIDIKKFYCMYQSMPSSIKGKISASMLITLVTDTTKRKKMYAEQSINTSGSLGAEICE
jgi:hypothetical protein